MAGRVTPHGSVDLGELLQGNAEHGQDLGRLFAA